MKNFPPSKPILLVIALLLAALFLVRYLSHDSTFALTIKPDVPQSLDVYDVGQADAETLLANCRYGVTSGRKTKHILTDTGAGVFYRWEPDWRGPLPENNAEFMHMIRTRQRKTPSGEYLPEWYTNVPLDEELAEIIRNDPGAVWMIGNEPERGPNPGETFTTRTDDIHAEIYAEAYHTIYHFIKGIDPTARVANAGLIQITPMRLQYLNLTWDAYVQKYGVPMPVDLWTIHAYVLPELTSDGQPNNIASAALGTDLALGKRASGFDASKCSDPAVYCSAEHDDVSLLEEQVISMRQWMKDHGQQEKPLVVTEYGTLYPYMVKENGQCDGLFDENGKCFTPERVSTFMLNTFDYFNNAQDPALGLSADNNKLVQQWIWYGAYAWDIGSSNLLEDDWATLTLMGKTYRDHVFAESTYLNLIANEAVGQPGPLSGNETTTAQLTANFRNNGNVSIEDPFSVTFYKDAALTQPIDSTTVTPIVRGCATRAYSAKIEWADLSTGTHQFWVKVDSNNAISESDESDNVGTGEVVVAGPSYMLDIQIISDGEGTGGSVSKTPEGPTYPEGTIVTLNAVPYSGWTFLGWKGAVVGNSPQETVLMDQDLSVEAHFLQDHYKLNIDQIGEGRVSIIPTKPFYTFGDEITLVAIPEKGWRFVEWRGDIDDTTPTIKYTFTDDTNITAVFEEIIPDTSHTVNLPVVIDRTNSSSQ